jgi:predicted acetyltransferase
MTQTYGIPADEAEQRRVADVLGRSFGYSADSTYERFPVVGPDNIRAYREDGRIDAALWLVPMGQWFGGRSVPMTGIAAVGVAPEARGRGLAIRLMTEALRELHEKGTALSGLYPATQTLYRKAGYEQGGCRYKTVITPGDIRSRGRDASIRAATEADRDTVERVYRTYARNMAGHLDRGPYIWDRVYAVRGEAAHGYIVEENGEATGHVYVIIRPVDTGSGGFTIAVTDLVALTPAAGNTLWSFLADHRSMSKELTWFTGPDNPMLFLQPEQPYKTSLQLLWMLRIADVTAALEARGYSPNVKAELHLKIIDEVVPGNAGTFVLQVEEGRGQVRRGGNPLLTMDIGALATLYAGFSSPWKLSTAGRLSGDAAALAAAAGVFSGSAPWMPDMF